MDHKIIQVSPQQAAEIAVLERAAHETVTRSTTKFLVFAIAAFGLVVVPMGVPVACLASLPLVFIAVKRAAQNGAAAAYIKETGNFAPLLNDRQLLKLTNLVGKETVLAQLKEALEDSKPLSHSALDYLEHCGIDTAPPDLKEALAAYDRRVEKEQRSQASTIDVKASTADKTSLLDGEASPVGNSDGSDVAQQSLIAYIASDPKSLFLSAPVRTGKGVLIAGAIRACQKVVKEGQHSSIKKITFWALTPKQFAGEHWYWQTVDQFHNPDLDAPGKIATVRSIYQFISAFTALPRDRENPTVLVIDEFSRLLGLTAGVKMWEIDPALFGRDNQGFDKWLVDKVMLSASMMQANGFYAWVILPANTVGSRGFSKGDADSFNVFTLASPSNLAFADGGGAAFAAPQIAADHPVFKLGYSAGYRKRDRKWYAIPDFGDVVNRKTDRDPPVELTNRWLPPLPPEEILTLDTLFAEGAAAEPIATSPTPKEESKPLSDYFPLFRYRPLLIWGPQGSGKSTIAREIVRMKLADGQSVAVLNPHGSPVEWVGASVVGAGRDYDEIHEFLRTYIKELKERYQQFSVSGMTEQQFLEHLAAQKMVFSPICEEMSGWYHNLNKSLLSSFALACLTESRKVLMPPVFVAHDRTLDFVGLKSGANLRDSGLVELELLAPSQDPETKLLRSSGKGILRIPGGSGFPVHFDNFDADASKKAEGQPVAAQTGGLTFTTAAGTPPLEPKPEDEKAVIVAEYMLIQPQCKTFSAVLEKLGTKLQRRGLIESRTVDCLKAWLIDNNLPNPGETIEQPA